MDLVVKGAEDLGVLAKRLKETGDKTLRKELLAGFRIATKGTKAKIRANALSQMPRRGGLAAVIAASKFTTKTTTSSRTTAIRIVATNQHSIRGMDRGRLKHPVYGNRDRWVSQSVKAGWFSDPIEADAPTIRAEVGRAMARVAAQLERN